MDLLITGLSEKDFNGFSFVPKFKQLKSRTDFKSPPGYTDKKPIKKKMLKQITIKIYLSDSEGVSYTKSAKKATISIR